jgi:D-glycero-D-manno-heptose 1,7-bisphosphate phosphatase
MSRPALFLDRDGVINHDAGYTHKIEDFAFIDGIFAVARWAAAGWPVIVVTNQGGIGKGLYTEADFAVLTEWVEARFAADGGPILQTYYSPYHPNGTGPFAGDSRCRKPNPGMLLDAATDHDLNLADSILVGDKESDMEAAFRVGIRRRILFAHPQGANSVCTDVVSDHAALLTWLQKHGN